jgi:hypothetical protein
MRAHLIVRCARTFQEGRTVGVTAIPKLAILDLPVLPTKDIPHGRHPAATRRCAGFWHFWPHYPAREWPIALTALSLLTESPLSLPSSSTYCSDPEGSVDRGLLSQNPAAGQVPALSFRSRRARHSVLFARAASSVCLKRSLVSNHILLRCGWKLELLLYIHGRKRGASAKRMIRSGQTARAYIPRSAIMVSN